MWFSRSVSLLAFFFANCYCSTIAQTVNPTLGWDNFIEGVSPVENLFEVVNVPSGTISVSFFVDGYNGLPLQIDNKGSDGWGKSFDMGRLQLGAKLTVICLSLTGDTLGDVATHKFNVIPQSSWLKESQVSVSSVGTRTVSLHASYPIGFLLDDQVPGDVVGMGGRKYSLFNPTIEMDIDYNLSTRRSIVTNPVLLLSINLFNQKSASRKIPLPSADVFLDSNFNLRLHAGDSTYLKLFHLDVPGITIPVASIVDIQFDAGVDLNAKLKAKVVVGNEGSDWGFVRDGDQITGVSATVEGVGWLRGGIRVLWGLASLRGQLTLFARLGSGVEYRSVPFSSLEPVFGGTFDVYGELKATAFWFITLFHIGPEHLWGTSFGRLPSRIVHAENSTLLKSSTSLVDESFIVPEFAPQPAMDANGGVTGVAWLEHRAEEMQLRFSLLDQQRSAFTSPQSVQSTTHPIASPKLSIRSDGTGLITWVQSRYVEGSVPEELRLIDMLNAQDIWIVSVDAEGRPLTLPVRVLDDTLGVSTGRGEGEPQILSFNDGSGLLVWMSINEANNGSELWYVEVNQFDNQLTLSSPKRVSAMSEANRSPVLAKLSDSEAELLWIHEGIDNDEMRVMRSTWRGSSWQEPVIVASAESGVTFDELVADGREERVLAAWTELRYSEYGRYDVSLSSVLRNPTTGLWEMETVAEWDSTVTFSSPIVSLSNDQQGVISYQVIPRTVDSLNPNNGRRFLGLRNLAESASKWKIIPGLEFLSDTTSFVWDAQTGFGSNGTFYLLTEEHGFSSEGGVIFGDSRLGLKLRAVQLTSDLEVLDTDEPITPTSGVPLLSTEQHQLTLTPNPTIDEVVLSYQIQQVGQVRIEVYDLLGQRIGLLLDQRLEVGTYQTMYHVSELSTGVYIIRLSTNENQIYTMLKVNK